MIAINHRTREWVHTQLDMSRDDDSELFAWITDWKEHRKFLPNLRTALWLFISLTNADISSLIELFPFVVDRLRAPDKKRIAELEAEIKATKQRVKELEDEKDDRQADKQDEILSELRKLSTQPVAHPSNGVSPLQAISPSQSGLNGANGDIRQIGTPAFDKPIFEDEENLLVVEKDLDSGARASQNFIDSLKALNP